MKSKEIIWSVVLVLAAGGMGGWYYASAVDYSLTATPSPGSSYTRDFTASGLVQQNTPQGATIVPYYKLFFFPGDGSFLLKDAAAGSAFVQSYTYANSDPHTYTSFIESTNVYDDGGLPPKVSNNMSVIVASDNPTSSYTPVHLGNHMLYVTPVRKIVTNDPVTYIVTYGNPDTSTNNCGDDLSGTVEFDYDPSVLEYTGAKPYIGETAPPPPTQPSGSVQWTFSGLDKGEQYNTFLTFKTRNVPDGHSVFPVPTAKITITNNVNVRECGLDPDNFVLSAQSMVESSHDPNHKTISPAEFCVNDNGSFKFLVTFQNDGTNPVDSVTITDKLDVLLEGGDGQSATCEPVLLDYGPKRQYSSATMLPYANGTTTTILNNLDMPGTHQSGYGTDFLEPETQGFLLFSIPMSCLSDRRGCSAVCNRASIVFGCNPPLETNLALSRIKCDSLWGPPPPMPMVAPCDTCQEVEITVPTPFADTVNSVLLDNSQTYLTAGYNYFKWYPSTGLDNAFSPNPHVLELANRTYTLVASGRCKRLILHRQVSRPCSLTLQFNYQITDHIGCDPLYNLTLSASNNGLNLDSLIWQDCSRGGLWSQDSVGAGTYYFSVKDPVTGCYAEQWVTLPDAPFIVTDNPGDCIFNPTIQGGTGTYSYHWQYQNWGWLGTSTSTAPPPFDLSGKRNIRVTITDSAGCEVVLNIKSRCRWWESPSVLALFGLVAFFFMGRWYWLRIRRKL